MAYGTGAETNYFPGRGGGFAPVALPSYDPYPTYGALQAGLASGAVEPGASDVAGSLAQRGALQSGWNAAKNLWNGGDFGLDSFNLGNVASSAGGALLSHFVGQKAHNAGGQIGGALGGIAGSFVPIPVLGTFAGAELGKAIGGAFGPRKTVGPGGTFGYDLRTNQPVGISGDNGWRGGELAAPAMRGIGALRAAAQEYGGTLNADALQFGQQPLQGQGSMQLAFTGPNGRMGGGDWMGNGGYNLADDDFVPDVIRSALGSGALQLAEGDRARLLEAIGGEQGLASKRAQAAADVHDTWLQANRMPYIQGSSAAGETAGDAGAAF